MPTRSDADDARAARPLLVECMPETGGERLAELMIPTVYGADYFEQLVRLAVQGEVELERFVRPQRSAVIRYVLQQEGELSEFAFPEKRAAGLIAQERLIRPGTRTLLARANLDRLAYFALAGELDEREALQRRAEVYAAEFTIDYRQGASS